MGGKLDVYLDIASFYTYIAFYHLLKNWDLLAAHGVQIDIHPVLLGAINVASGNKPPWSLPAKAKYGDFDGRRSQLRAGKPDITMPKDLMARSMTIHSLRVLHVIKVRYPEAVYLTAWHWLLHCFWEPPALDLTKPDVLAKALADAPARYPPGDDAEGRLFSEAEVRKILEGAATQEAKDAVKATTQEAVDRGAFGAPWLWAVNDAGKGEPFFGSDRFHFVYDHLGVPYQDIAILPPQKSIGAKL
ncbi:Glutathione S-transferase kappa 1 [Colletotrichum tanaceti]|uniref:Glutathione S-transferase kappa 1 n=1 Tax=Colletotrichum tanaceti TaxID=1306861 RepID=A0A4U6X3B8_9PEZI|nr:Glutathione S-transferase kappa 1 [Colletotrichum tanaceti]TKW49403.1 Glutathione S-transferase kappa 1 [Colletotrichum tanaceti]